MMARSVFGCGRRDVQLLEIIGLFVVAEVTRKDGTAIAIGIALDIGDVPSFRRAALDFAVVFLRKFSGTKCPSADRDCAAPRGPI